MVKLTVIEGGRKAGEPQEPPPASASCIKRKACNQHTLAAAVTRVVNLDESIRYAATRAGESAPYRTETVIRSLARLGAQKLELQGRSLRAFVTQELRRAA